jgi:adenylate kinase family enzyme
MLPLSALGRRICIFGPSNAGKSTLAVAIGRELDLPVVHLDLLRHLPHTDWRQRPDADFKTLHDAAIAAEGWVMEGNYSRLYPQRLARATGGILIDANRWRLLARYFRRTLIERKRFGALDGHQDSIKWAMIDWIMVRSPPNTPQTLAALEQSGLPRVVCRDPAELRALYKAWDLKRPEAD